MENTLSQVAIAVDDIEKAKGVFELLFNKKASEKHNVFSQNVNVSFIEIGTTKIELLEPANDDTPITNFLRKKGPGVHHIAVKTKKFTQLIGELERAGIRVLGKPEIGAEGSRVVFFHPKDTFGVLIELEEEL